MVARARISARGYAVYLRNHGGNSHACFLIEKLMLIAVLLLVLIVELMNSAIEAVVDRVSLEYHPLSKNAKDIGSAAVLLTCVLAAATWVTILADHFYL
jgi:diacylglycerol kinase